MKGGASSNCKAPRGCVATHLIAVALQPDVEHPVAVVEPQRPSLAIAQPSMAIVTPTAAQCVDGESGDASVRIAPACDGLPPVCPLQKGEAATR